jgi:hypothetical protein
MSTLTVEQAWQQPCDQPRRTFQAGIRVQHRNPQLADWRGVVVPETTGRHKGKCLRLSMPFDGEPVVHITWTTSFGTTSGWYGVTALAADAVPDAVAFVARGVALLDEREPGWDQLVNVDVLDMADTHRCLLAQTWTGPTERFVSPYTLHSLALFPDDDGSEAAAHGIDSGLDGPSLEELAAEWERVILARRAGAR